ncbi:winged helix-turn-helix transcriptional regulator [Halococcus sp. AFM35]|jgi:Lrp/AsnC family leucine-responsive transcriptional regulator|uniref:winged helix-turn-helix transcriptional regulator n=1 Tax=Halococcus sp. AFM35 TaxID=3421653 RepID=UPI003EBAACE5
MTGIDDVDYRILELLMDDARRSYRDIAEEVDRSPPTVSERVERLEEVGVIEGFTLDVDRSMLVEGPTVLVDLAVEPGSEEMVVDSLTDAPAVEHVIRTVDAAVVFVAHANERDVGALLSETLGDERVRDYRVRLVGETKWEPRLDEEHLAIECVVCGKAVEGGDESVDLGDRTYEVCCSSCASEIKDQYDALQQAASE